MQIKTARQPPAPPPDKGTTTADDLVPTLLGMYDALIGRSPAPPPAPPRQPPPPPPKPKQPPAAHRPLSVISIASSSSSSSSSVTSSCSSSGRVGRSRLGASNESTAYLASIESLEDSDEGKRIPASALQRLKGSSQGSGDSGVHSPCSFISSPSLPHSRPRYCDPHLSYRDRVVIEIIETEAVYVADLKQVIVVRGISFLMQLVGGFLYSLVRDAVSRKTFVLAMNIPQILAFLMMYFATSIYELLAAQAIIGISIGFMKAPLLSYLGEVLDPGLRGTIVSLSGVFLNFGALLATIIGASVDWRTMTLYISVMPVVSLILVSMIPNSPAWLVLKERVDDAEKAYQILRGWVPASEVQEELTALVNYVKNKTASNNEQMNEDEQPVRKSKLDLFLHPSVFRPLRLVALYMFTALCTSLFGMRSYFKEVATVIELPIGADRALMCLNGLTMTGSLVASLAIRRLGKRGLTFMSLTLTTTSTLGLGLYVLMDCRLPWIPMVLFGTTYFGAHAGLLVIPWVLISEIFPLRTRSETTGVATSFCYLAMFIVVMTFYSIVDLLDLSGAFLFYGGVGVIGYIYLYFGLHETEGVPLEDIEALFIPENKSIV